MNILTIIFIYKYKKAIHLPKKKKICLLPYLLWFRPEQILFFNFMAVVSNILNPHPSICIQTISPVSVNAA